MKKWLRRSIVLLIVLISLYPLRTPVFRAMGRWLVIGTPLQAEVDDVFILGGGADTRPLIASELMKAQMVNRVLVSNPNADSGEMDGQFSEADLIEGMLVAEGVEQSQLERVTVDEASTAGEIRAMKTHLEAYPNRTLAIVTHNYHTRRVQLLCHRYLNREACSRIHIIACPTDEFGPDDWWTYEAGIQNYLLEYLKLSVTSLGR